MRRVDETEKAVIFTNCAAFSDCINEINNNPIDDAKYIDVEMPMYNTAEYSNNYSKTSGSLKQHYGDEPNDNIANFESFEFKVKRKEKIPDDDNKKNIEMAMPSKYISNFGELLKCH